MRRWKTWWITCAPAAWIDVGLLTEQDLTDQEEAGHPTAGGGCELGAATRDDLTELLRSIFLWQWQLAGGAGQERYQHDAHDRYSAGAADYLHGDFAGDAAWPGCAGASAAAPNQKQHQADDRTVVIVIDKTGKLKINQDDTRWDQLEARLIEYF